MKVINSSLRPRAWSRLAIAAAMVCSSLAAHAFEKPEDGVYKDRIDWGVMMDMSGPASASQLPWVQGFQAYIRKLNEGGGVNGRKINVLAEDDRYDATRTRANFERLADQTPALGVSGLGNSSAQAALAPTIRKGKMPVVGTYTTTRVNTQPASPMFYASFCGFKQMAQVGVNFFADKLKTKAPKVAAVHLDVASGVEYFGYVNDVVKGLGGEAQSIPIKVAAADATPQVLEIIKMKPDFITVHGVVPTSILLMRTMKQYGLNIPTFAITYLGAPGVYAALGPELGQNYYFVSCFTPGSLEEGTGGKEMSAFADKIGQTAVKDDINYVAGWAVAQMVAEVVAKTGPEPTREKMVAYMAKGFEVDTKGVSSQIKYTPEEHGDLQILRPYSYDYDAKKFKAYGSYNDYQKYVK